MHPDTERLITMAQSKGSITQRQQEMILSKARDMGDDPVEVEFLLAGIPVEGSAQDVSQQERPPATKKCQHCGGEIPADAIKCYHCHKWVAPETQEYISYITDVSNQTATGFLKSQLEKGLFLKKCPYCGMDIPTTAFKCSHCAEFVDFHFVARKTSKFQSIANTNFHSKDDNVREFKVDGDMIYIALERGYEMKAHLSECVAKFNNIKALGVSYKQADITANGVTLSFTNQGYGFDPKEWAAIFAFIETSLPNKEGMLSKAAPWLDLIKSAVS